MNSQTHNQTHITEIQTYIQTDIQTYRHTDRQYTEGPKIMIDDIIYLQIVIISGPIINRLDVQPSLGK